MPLNAVVITSRTEPALGAVDRTTLYPIRLVAGTIVPFVIGYLDRMDAAGELRDNAVQPQLAERICGPCQVRRAENPRHSVIRNRGASGLGLAFNPHR